MKILTWVVQALLAAAFLMAGFMKSTQPIEQLSAMLPWTGQVPAGLVRFIGVSELVGGLGLVLPWLTGIRRNLTPLAAWGLVAVMGLASAFHLSKGEFAALPINLVLGGLAAFVAIRRGRELNATN